MRAYHSLLASLALAGVVAAPARGAPLEVEVYRAAGTPQQLELRGRVYRDRVSGAIPAGEGAKGEALRKNAGALLTDEIEGAEVVVEAAGQQGKAVTDEDGFFALTLSFEPPAAPGRLQVVARARKGDEEASGEELALIRPAAGELLVITDFDDTQVHTHVTSKGKFLESVFLRDAGSLEVIPRMPGLMRCLALGRSARGERSTSIHYLSASPVNFHGKLSAFLTRHRFPLGAIHLRHLEVNNLSDSSPYKKERIAQIAARFPGYPILLMGDGGEHDPEVYRELREQLGDRVKLILIRKVEGEDESPARFEGMKRYVDGSDAAATLIEAGLLHPACAEYRPKEKKAP
ncbi:MAG: DUF2183 domain-containing protein [Deltaproteobacteria bacterium]|nr:DUF2183 domain-containing protein [Deltaproteobacteria bacterium]